MADLELRLELSPKMERFLAASRGRAAQICRDPLAPGQKMWNWGKAFFETCRDEPLRRRQALAFAHTLKAEPVMSLDGQLSGLLHNPSCGYWYPRKHDVSALYPEAKDFDPFHRAAQRIAAELPELLREDGISSVEEMERSGGRYHFPIQCAPGHIGWRWDWVVKDGFAGLLGRIARSMTTADAKGHEELEGMKICVEAALAWAEAHLAIAAPHQRAVLERVPRHGARNFLEAVQAFHFAYILGLYDCPYGGNGPGRLDYHLWPYLEADLRSGAQTLDFARNLLDELFILFNERCGFGEETIVVGGCHADGSCAANALTKIAVESIMTLKRFLQPPVYIRVPKDAPDWLWDLSARFLAEGGNRAQILNDEAIVQAVAADGHIPLADARDYMCGGGMEVSPFGMNGDLLFTGFFNVGKVLELALTCGSCLLTGERLGAPSAGLAGFGTFEELYAAFLAELDRRLTNSFRRMDIHAEELARLRPAFFVSSLVADCVENARVINDGGARYEDFGSTPLGIPNAADSLLAIKKAVFEQSFVEPGELLEALRANFVGHEALRLRLLALPKYGQGDAEADALMGRLVEDICAIYANYRNHLGGRVKPMIMTFVMAPIVGSSLGAMPDGRRARTPIAHGITPQAAAMTGGISTVMRSATSVPLALFSGGASHMWDFDAALANAGALRPLLEVFFKSGGQMFQGNMASVEEMRAAVADPEPHRGLTVRVGGFSAAFVSLGENVQTEIIERHHHAR